VGRANKHSICSQLLLCPPIQQARQSADVYGKPPIAARNPPILQVNLGLPAPPILYDNN